MQMEVIHKGMSPLLAVTKWVETIKFVSFFVLSAKSVVDECLHLIYILIVIAAVETEYHCD